MQFNIDKDSQSPVDRGYVISMVIDSFKGYKDVEVHLYRPDWKEEETKIYDWEKLLGDPIRENKNIDTSGSRKLLLETFNIEERDQILDYLQTRYQSRLKSITSSVLPFPIPLGLVPLSEIPEEKTISRIYFEKIPNYSLNFPVHGIYDLSRHSPLSKENF